MKKKKKILLLIETSRGHGRRILGGIASYVREFGDWQVYFEDRGVLQKPPKWISHWKGDGIIARTTDQNTGKMLRDKGVPLVELLGGEHFEPDINESYDMLGSLASEHFINRGLRNFASFRTDNTKWSELRGEWFAKHLEKAGFSCDFCPLPKGRLKDHLLDSFLESPDSYLADWLRRLPKPVGIFTAIDIQAFYILVACQSVGIAVPEEVAILGCGNDELICSLLNPQLSSVDLNSWLLGYTAAQLLAEKMKHPKKRFDKITVNPSHVVIRPSTDIVAIEDPDVAKAVRFMRDHFMESIGIAEVAKGIGMTVRTLQRHFRQCLGRSPETELTRIRLEHAKYLLCNTNLPVMEIGYRTGFAPPQYFIQVFRRACGMTPNQYRLKNRVILPDSL